MCHHNQAFFPAARDILIKAWVKQPESIALGCMQEDKLTGYGVIRRCRSGYKIGPLFADSPEIAEALFLALQARVKTQEPMFLDAPEVNEAAIALAKQHNMQPVFGTARMYTGVEPDISLARTFGVTSFEVG